MRIEYDHNLYKISGATEHGYRAIIKIIPGDDVDTIYPGHQETTLMLPTLGIEYLEERCRRYIRVQQPRKPPMRNDVDTAHPGHQLAKQKGSRHSLRPAKAETL
ncbi:hypothetical protein TSAR_015226, partial [Trichomalopsis sarcophagae]